MDIGFVKTSPTENMTILVTSEVSAEIRASVAQRLMAYTSVHAEQVGFVVPPYREGAASRLEMAGGEFCGNAVLSLAALVAMREIQRCGRAPEQITLEASGAPRPVACRVLPMAADREFMAEAAMPLPDAVGRVKLPLRGASRELDFVRLPGITHILAPADLKIPRDEAEQLVQSWARELAAPALGLLFVSSHGTDEGGVPCLEMAPLVCVPGESLIWERGCGSGTAALGALESLHAGGRFRAKVSQPGGTIGVEARSDLGQVIDLAITGRVVIVAEGTAYI